MTTALPPSALAEVLAFRRQAALRADYAAHLTWLVGAQLYTLGGGQDYPVPDPAALFAPAQRDRHGAEDIRQRVLRQLRHDPPGSAKGG